MSSEQKQQLIIGFPDYGPTVNGFNTQIDEQKCVFKGSDLTVNLDTIGKNNNEMHVFQTVMSVRFSGILFLTRPEHNALFLRNTMTS